MPPLNAGRCGNADVALMFLNHVLILVHRATIITLPPMFIGWLFDSYVGLGLSVAV